MNSEDVGANQEQETIEENVIEVGNADRNEETVSQAADIAEAENQGDESKSQGKILSYWEVEDIKYEIDSIEKINKYMIPEQSFDITLADWGEVTFVSCRPTYKNDPQEYASFFLLRDEQILYRFPYLDEDNTMGHVGSFDNVGAVAFRDINGDGKSDIIIITYYESGAGPTGMVPRPEIRIFLAGENEFYLAEDMIIDVTQHIFGKDMTIETICNYIQENTETSEDAMNVEDTNVSSPLAGVTMEVTKNSDTSVTVRITNDTDKRIGCGADFYLEIYDEKAGDWRKVDKVNDDPFYMVVYKIQKVVPYEKVIDLEGIYGKLEPGRYRIVKTVMDLSGTGDHTDYTYTAEFCVEEEM